MYPDSLYFWQLNACINSHLTIVMFQYGVARLYMAISYTEQELDITHDDGRTWKEWIGLIMVTN